MPYVLNSGNIGHLWYDFHAIDVHATDVGDPGIEDDGDDDDDPDSAASASVSLSRARKCVSSPPEREQLCNASFQELAQNMKNKNIGNQSAIQTKKSELLIVN